MFKRLVYVFVLVFLFVSHAHAKRVEHDSRVESIYRSLVSCNVFPRRFHTFHDLNQRDLVNLLSKSRESSYCKSEEVELLKERLSNLLGLNESHPELSLGTKIKIKPITKIGGRYGFISSGDSRYTINGRGQIDATTNLFRDSQKGRVLGIGHQDSLYTEHEISGSGFDFFVRPELSILTSSDLSQLDQVRLTVDEAYLDLDLWKFRLSGGRSQLIWGQGRQGGFIFSDNARALDHFSIANKDGFRLPWVFRHLGEWKFGFVFGNLGPEQFFPWTYFAGIQFGIKPVKTFEFNLAHMLQVGGRGGPSVGLGTGAREFFGFLPGVSQSGQTAANKITEVNLRWSLPKFMGLETYLSYMLDDANTGSLEAFEKMFLYNSSYHMGFEFLRFWNSLENHFRFEYTNSSHIAYRQGTYQNGWTINENLLGQSPGPDGHLVSIQFDRQWTDNYRGGVQFQYQVLENKTYLVTNNGLTVTVTSDLPAEKRLFLGSRHFYEKGRWSLDGELGFQFIKNFQFAAGQTKKAFLGRLGLSYRI